jgi:hypothetical protein
MRVCQRGLTLALREQRSELGLSLEREREERRVGPRPLDAACQSPCIAPDCMAR